MARVKKIALGIAFFIIFIGLAIGTIFVANQLAKRQSKTTAKSESCQQPGRLHRVVIQNNRVQPASTTASLCDQLSILNKDNQSRLIAFGSHDKHTEYDGIEEQLLPRGKSLSITLDQLGSFRFHDHLDDQVQGTFTVK